MPMLPDGSVIPSYLGVEPMGMSSQSVNFGEFALRQGEIREIVYPDDKRSVTKTVVEYMVVVAYRDGNGPAVSTLYPNCQVANLFGGIADKLRYTYRPQSKDPDAGKAISDGSKVLLLCANGERRRAFIVGGLNESQDAERSADGHNLNFSFNGITVVINKDGEFGLQFVGPTKVDGSLDTDAGADEKNGPTQVEVLKNGNLKISTKDDNQVILINHAEKKIEFTVDQEWVVNVNEKVTESYGDSWTLTAGSSISIESKSEVNIMASDGDWNMTASGNARIKSSGTLIGAATDSMLLASAYRSAEQTLHGTLTEQLTTLAAQIAIIAVAVNGPMKIPIYGAAAASVAMGPALIQCGTAVTQMLAALQEFEGQGATYLSLKNKND